jgi:hypothetical protein
VPVARTEKKTENKAESKNAGKIEKP